MRPKPFFEELPSNADPSRLAGIEHVYVFDIAGEGRWKVVLHDGKLTVSEGAEDDGDVVFSMSAETFDRITDHKQNPMLAYMTGKVKVTGDVKAAMDLQNIL
jgi:putative sterol carrier protein